MRWHRSKLDELGLEAPTPVVHAAMLLEAEAAGELVAPYGDRQVPPRRIRRRVDERLARAKVLRRELEHREERDRIARDRDRLRTALEARLAEPVVQPQKWENLRDAVELIEGMLREDAVARARVEIVTAYVVDVMAGIGLDYRDASVLYSVLSGAGLVTELAANGHKRGEVDQGTVVAIARVVQTLTAALIPYLPDDVKPNLDVVIPDDPSALFEGWGSVDEAELPGDLTAEKIRSGEADDEVVSHVGEIYFDSHETINRECELCQRAAAIGAFDRYDTTDADGWPVDTDPED